MHLVGVYIIYINDARSSKYHIVFVVFKLIIFNINISFYRTCISEIIEFEAVTIDSVFPPSNQYNKNDRKRCIWNIYTL